MLPLARYKEGKYPPNSHFPRFSSAGPTPAVFKQLQDKQAHTADELRGKKASTEILKQRAAAFQGPPATTAAQPASLPEQFTIHSDDEGSVAEPAHEAKSGVTEGVLRTTSTGLRFVGSAAQAGLKLAKSGFQAADSMITSASARAAESFDQASPAQKAGVLVATAAALAPTAALEAATLGAGLGLGVVGASMAASHMYQAGQGPDGNSITRPMPTQEIQGILAKDSKPFALPPSPNEPYVPEPGERTLLSYDLPGRVGDGGNNGTLVQMLGHGKTRARKKATPAGDSAAPATPTTEEEARAYWQHQSFDKISDELRRMRVPQHSYMGSFSKEFRLNVLLENIGYDLRKEYRGRQRHIPH